MSNVRFYRLGTLPSFDNTKHVGIFVHATGTTGGSDTYLMATNVNFNQWLTDNHYTEIPSGLWFGGENGWELLSSDTTSGKIDAAIDAKIKELDVNGYAQATISTTTDSSTLTIKGIQEVDGKIGIPADSENLDLDIAIDGVYNSSTNKIATQDTVTNAINGLDTGIIQPVEVTTTTENSNTTLTFKGVKEIDGKIYQGDNVNPSTLVVGDAKLQIKIGSTDAFEVFSANAQEDRVIQLDGNVFKKKEDVISVITKNNDVSSTNPLVTQNDINSLAGAMHYRGGVTSVPNADNSTKKGDVWIVTTAFEGYEAGDMFIARADGASATFDEVQGNLTLGTNDGQIAKNDGNLADGKLVVATLNGIKTTDISASVLDEANNTRKLGYSNVAGGVTIIDNLKIMNRNFDKAIKIVSENDSIQITSKHDELGNLGINLDLIWNTSIE